MGGGRRLPHLRASRRAEDPGRRSVGPFVLPCRQVRPGVRARRRATQGIRAGENDSYARLLNLWKARALLYDASANESLVQIAPDGALQFNQAGAAYLRDYYAFTGPFAERIAAANLTTPHAIRDFVRGYEDAGCDHLVLFPTVADLTQLDRLADVLA